jgi:hypothetical protein
MRINFFAKRNDESIHDLIYFYCLCLLLISLPTSIYFVSVAQILMGANWLAEGAYCEKLKRFLRNRPAIFLSSIFLLYLTGIFWTQDLAYGIGYDLLNKLPLFTLTFLVASSRQVSNDRLNALLVLFSLAVFVTSLIGLAIFISNEYIDPREISPFIMHVYFSLMVVMAIFLLPWVSKRISSNKNWFFGAILVSVWLFVFLFILGSMTGILSFAGVLAFLVVREFFRKSLMIKKVLAGLAIGVSLIGIAFLIMVVLKPIWQKIAPEPDSLIELTAEGNLYQHDLEEDLRENGHLVYLFIAEEELRNAWNNRSTFDFDSSDLKGQELRATIYRYLSSKALRKDKEGLNNLSPEEIEAIEHGVPNHLYTRWPNAIIRIHQSFWEINEYARTGNPSGHSFIQRVELWRAAWIAFKEYPLFGWGTGDIFLAMDFGLSSIDSPIEDYEMKPHNQFLNILIMIGIVGFFLFSGLFILFVKTTKAYQFLPFNIMLVIVFVAMFGTNLIDFQIGLTFFLFFSIFFGILYNIRTSNDMSSPD